VLDWPDGRWVRLTLIKDWDGTAFVPGHFYADRYNRAEQCCPDDALLHGGRPSLRFSAPYESASGEGVRCRWNGKILWTRLIKMDASPRVSCGGDEDNFLQVEQNNRSVRWINGTIPLGYPFRFTGTAATDYACNHLAMWIESNLEGIDYCAAAGPGRATIAITGYMRSFYYDN